MISPVWIILPLFGLGISFVLAYVCLRELWDYYNDPVLRAFTAYPKAELVMLLAAAIAAIICWSALRWMAILSGAT